MNIRVVLLSFCILLLTGCGQNEASQSPREVRAVDCDAAQTQCHIDVDGLKVSLALQPGLVVLKPFEIVAKIEGAKGLEQVIIDFQMVGMDMGFNRYRLLAEGDMWKGTATLPVCTTTRNDWLAVIEFNHQGRDYRLLFPFTSR